VPQNRLICGVDEAGRGPLAGEVVAACVILNPRKRIRGLADSKQLSPGQREALTAEIKEKALAWAVASASVEEIDRINILRASLLAMKRALELLALEPGEVLVDGLYCPESRFPSRPVVHGDSLVPAISAASILAKCARDADMVVLHGVRPEYGFDRHKGYSTPEHLDALRLHGPSQFHRRSFAPVRELLDQLRLF
jgi:ribonuclease HII